MKISEVIAKYDTDKIEFHRYGSTYDTLFENIDRFAKLNILEVGTQKGGSLLAWKEYFPNANVYGVDIIDVVPDKYRKDTVTRIISDIKDWKNDIEWDIVIDDGSHYIVDIAYVISQYVVKLKPKGMIIIEDVRDPGLLMRVTANLLAEITIPFPDYASNPINKGMEIMVRNFDTSAPGAGGSFIMALVKQNQ